METVERVVNGTFSMQFEHQKAHQLEWNANLAKIEAEDMFDRIFNMKFLPPGRGLWGMGTGIIITHITYPFLTIIINSFLIYFLLIFHTALTTDRKLYAALNNCAFVSTKDLASDPVEPFCFLMDASMLGVGTLHFLCIISKEYNDSEGIFLNYRSGIRYQRSQEYQDILTHISIPNPLCDS